MSPLLPFRPPFRSLLTFAVSVVAAMGASSARAGIVVVDQVRRIDAEASHQVTVPEVVDTKAASNTSHFDGEAFARVSDEEPGSEFATSRVTQVSDIEGGVSASGTFDFQVSGQFARGRSQLVVVYEVTNSNYDYNLNYLLGPVTSELGVRGVAFEGNIQLTRLNGRGGESPKFEPIDIDLADRGDDAAPNQAADTLTGRLVPGLYRFTFDMQGLSIDFNHSYGANYRVDLGFQQVAPTPVPLPPAGRAGLFGLGGVAALGVLRRRAVV
jgi:hypothetical protein